MRGTRNDGSVFKRVRRGRVEWVGEVTIGFDGEGRRKKRTVYGQTRGEAARKLAEIKEQLHRGVDLVRRAGRQRLADFLASWLEAGSERWKAGTHANYVDLVRLHLRPHPIAGIALEELQPGDVAAWQSALRRAKVGGRTRASVFSLLSTALRAAVKQNAILFNSAERCERPLYKKSQRVILDREHVLALLATAEGSPYEAAFVLAVLHGLRIGEVLGVRWGDLDLRGGVMRVHHQLAEDRRTGQRELAEVKTDAGRREIPLCGRAVAALERHQSGLGAVLPHPDRLVFVDGNGAPLRRSNFHRRVWVPLRQAAGLPAGCRFHDLRHANASALISSGVDIATTSGLLGHSSPAVTMRVYAHAQPSRKREAADSLDRIYGSA